MPRANLSLKKSGTDRQSVSYLGVQRRRIALSGAGERNRDELGRIVGLFTRMSTACLPFFWASPAALLDAPPLRYYAGATAHSSLPVGCVEGLRGRANRSEALSLASTTTPPKQRARDTKQLMEAEGPTRDPSTPASSAPQYVLGATFAWVARGFRNP